MKNGSRVCKTKRLTWPASFETSLQISQQLFQQKTEDFGVTSEEKDMEWEKISSVSKTMQIFAVVSDKKPTVKSDVQNKRKYYADCFAGKANGIVLVDSIKHWLHVYLWQHLIF